MSAIERRLGYSIRLLFRNPSVTVIACVTLAIGIGANVTLFSVVNAVLLRALPFRDPGRLMFIYETRPDVPRFPASYLDYEDWREQNSTFDDMAAYCLRDYNKPVLISRGEPRQVTAAFVSDNLFSLMSIKPRLGRAFLPDEDRPGRDQPAILGHSLWEQAFGADDRVLGTSIQVNGKAYTVVGVMGPAEQFPREADVWFPISQLDPQDLTHRERRRFWVVGRLKPGVSEAQALTDLRQIAGRLEQAYPDADRYVSVVQFSLLDYYTGSVKTILLLVFGVAGLVLLIACANVSNLLLGHVMNRRREIAIRVAHGASRRRILSQFLTESLVLAAVGSSGGLAIAVAGVSLLKRWALTISHIPRLDSAEIDQSVVVYVVAVAVVTGLLFGTLPAVRASGIDLGELREGGRGIGGVRENRLRNLLIIGEVAIAVTVMISTGLLVRTLSFLVHAQPGFRTDDLLTVQLRISNTRYSDYAQLEAFYLRLLQNIDALPGVNGAAATNTLPIVPSLSLMHFAVEGAAPRQLAEYPVGQTRVVSPGYFELMDIPIRTGRTFQPSDLARPQRGCIVNETLARNYFPGQSPLGKRIEIVESPKRETVPIIGVASDVRDLGVDREPEPEMYFLGFGSDEILLIHSQMSSLALAAAIRAEIQSIDPYQPVGQIRTMQSALDESFSRRRLVVSLMGSFSLLAVILSCIGIYGVTSYSAIQRASEIAMRMALGATRLSIIRLLLRQGLVPVAVGVVLGLSGAWFLATVLRGLLYGVSTTDCFTYATVAALIPLIAGAAILLPTLRLTRIDPLATLRGE